MHRIFNCAVILYFCKGDDSMPAFKDSKTGKWFAKFYYTDWIGDRKQKWKRGFATKKEAQAFERDFLERQAGSPDIKGRAC